MDYSLPCACMFTEQQANYMRTFTQALRPGIFSVVNYDLALGVGEVQSLQFDVCPNPTDGFVQVTLPDGEPFAVYVVTNQGQIVDVVKNARLQTEVSLVGLPAGVYFLRIVSQGKIVSAKVVKQ